MDPARCDSWKIIKYRELKRTDRVITNDIVLMHDPSRKTLCVYWNGSEIDRVFYHMEVNRYPLFKFKDNNFFVYFNESGQGFRLTFESTSERTIFFKVMQKLTYISESPMKSLSQSTDMDEWGSWPSSFSSQPVSQASSIRSIKKRGSSAKNLSSTFMSQPVYNPYGVSPSLPSSQPVMHTNKPFYDFERMSPASPASGLSMSSSFQSSYSCLSNSNCSISSVFSQSRGLRDSQLSSESPHPFTPPMLKDPPPSQKIDKSCQTDSYVESILSDKAAMLEHLKILMSNPEFLETVKMVKESMQTLDQRQLDDFKRKLNDIPEEKKVFTDLDSSSNRMDHTQSLSIVTNIPEFTQQVSEKEEWSPQANRSSLDFFDRNEPSCSYSSTQPVRSYARIGNKRASEVEEPSTSKTPKFRRLVDKFVSTKK